jgi:alditol oxidase
VTGESHIGPHARIGPRMMRNLDEVFASGCSVSVFTGWGDPAGEVWVKSRVTEEPEPVVDGLFAAVAATVERHPILGADPAGCTPQLGRPGPWSDRLPHFRMEFTPSHGEELQSEYFVPRRHAVAAIEAVRGLADRVRPVLQVSEIRTVAADRQWMSPHHGRGSVALHFTWKRDQAAVDERLPDFARVMARLDPRGAFRHDWLARHVLP